MSNNQYEDQVQIQKNNQNMSQEQNNVNQASPIKRISNFLQEHKISIHDFWQSDRNHASPEDIVNFCKNCGLLLSSYDVTNLKAQIFADKEIIFLQKFCELIPCWKSEGKEMVSNFLKKRSDLLVDKLLQSKQKQRAKSGQSFHRNNSNRKSLMRVNTSMKLKKQQTFKPNNSQQYLRKYRQRQLIQEKELAETIQKNKIDYEYGMLLKMSELNDSNKESKSHETYRAYKSAQGNIKVRVFNLNRFQKQISLKQFETIYKNFKKSTKENKQWVVANPNTGNLSQAQQRRNKNNQKSERQQQLQNLLANTVNLTNLLKEQIKIFKMKGIYGCQNW